jgi:hypothetical protein
MKPRQILLILAGLVIAGILAFYLQDVIRRAVVTPLAYLWWVLKLAYAAIPQLLWWILLLAVLILIVIISLVNWFTIGKKFEEPTRPGQGNVEILAGWVSNAGKGNYYKWMIANRLGKLWGEMSGRPENRGRPALPAEGPSAPSQHPPEAVQRYLKAGLDESFVDYPLSTLPFMRKKATPFDLNVDEAVGFLESQMEAGSGKKHP